MKQTEMTKEDLQINDGDSLIIPSDVEVLFLECCDCGLIHKIDIKRGKEGDIELVFNRMSGKNLIKIISQEGYDLKGIIKRNTESKQ